MKPILLKTIYCKKPDQIKSARAFGYIMHAVGLNRIFSKSNLLELLIRFQLMFPDCDLSNNYFRNSYLFSYNLEDDGMMEYYTMEDLVNNLGLEINESIFQIERDTFLKNVHSMRSNSVLGGILSFGCVLIPLRKEFSNDDTINVIDKKREENSVGIIDETRILGAEKLAEIIVNRIDQEEFINLERRTASRRAEIEKELANIPTVRYNPNDIPIHVKQKIYLHVADIFGMKDKLGNPDPQAIEYGDDLCHLIWLWANGFVEEGIHTWVNEHHESDFDYDKPVYSDADGGGPENLNEARQILEIDQFFPDFKIQNK